MQKIASRAWKRNFGTLSEEGVKRLKSTGVLNHKKEMDGLNKGTSNMIKEMNLDVSRTGVKKTVGNLLSNFDNPKLKIKGSGPMSMPSYGGSSRNKVHLPSFTKDFSEELGKKRGRVDIAGSGNRKYVDAVVQRHEIDEARAYRKYFKDKGGRNAFQNIEQVAPHTKGNSHFAPDVIFRESANVAIAPKSVKRSMRGMRNYSGELKENDTYLRKLKYGKDAVVDNKLLKETNKTNTGSNNFVKGFYPNNPDPADILKQYVEEGEAKGRKNTQMAKTMLNAPSKIKDRFKKIFNKN